MEMSIREQVVPATREHVDQMKGRFRLSDEREARAIGEANAYSCAVTVFHLSSKAWTGLLYGKPIVMFGASDPDFITGTSRPWMFGTEDMHKAGLSVLRRTKKYMKEIREGTDRLEASVHKHNIISLKWLKWIGFKPGGYTEDNPSFYNVWM